MKLLKEGSWNKGLVDYKLYFSEKYPEHLPVISVGALVFEGNAVGLTHNAQRGWEFPAGHIELGETIHEALDRELKEELAVSVKNPSLIGFKKIHCRTEIINKSTGKPYPRESLLLWFSAELEQHLDISCLDLEEDVDNREFVTFGDKRLIERDEYVLFQEFVKNKNQD